MAKAKDFKGWYNSTSGFVNQNNLHKEAETLWGADWEPADDTDQIQELLNVLGFPDLMVKCVDHRDNDDLKVCTRKYKFTKKQLVEVLKQNFLAGNNFGAENHNNDNDDDYNEAEKSSIDAIIQSLTK